MKPLRICALLAALLATGWVAPIGRNLFLSAPGVEKSERVATTPEAEVIPVSLSRVPLDPSATKGRPVASVGDEVITLPELIAVVKARLGQLGPDAAPNRRQVIALARSTLKSMIIASLVTQEAREKLGSTGALDPWKARFERTWNDQELPKILAREGVATEAELRSKLARALSTVEALRDDFLVRSLAMELIRRDRLDLDYDGYLEALRHRRPIASMMSPAELIAAGRRALADPEDKVER